MKCTKVVLALVLGLSACSTIPNAQTLTQQDPQQVVQKVQQFCAMDAALRPLTNFVAQGQVSAGLDQLHALIDHLCSLVEPTSSGPGDPQKE